MNIQVINAFDFRPAFRDGPYAMSHVVQERFFGRIIAVQFEDSSYGLGEIVLPPSLGEAARDQVLVLEDSLFPLLLDRPAEHLAETINSLRDSDSVERSLAFALETAWLDNRGKRQQRPLYNLLGGRSQDSVDNYFSISERQPGRVAERLTLAGPGRRVVQLKLGINSPADDIELLKFTLDRLDAGQQLLADANGAWSPDDACDLINSINDRRVLWEEPCNNIPDNRAVAEHTGQRILFDQCIGRFDAAFQLLQEGVPGAICIKPAFLGGLYPASRLRDICIKTGVPFRIDGPWCGDVATAAIAHLAVTAPASLLIAGCDLREPLLIDEPLEGIQKTAPGKISPWQRPGIGITLDSGFSTPDKTFTS